MVVESAIQTQSVRVQIRVTCNRCTQQISSIDFAHPHPSRVQPGCNSRVRPGCNSRCGQDATALQGVARVQLGCNSQLWC